MSPSGIRAAALVGTALGWTLSGRASLDGEKAAPGKYSRCIEYPWDGLPEPHAHRTNPLTGADAATEAGVGPYRDHCAVCHGVSGKGGRPGRRLPEPTAGEPGLHARHAGPHRPVSLLDDLRRGWHLDTAMPAFGGMLREHEIWQIVHYVRAGFQQPMVATR